MRYVRSFLLFLSLCLAASLVPIPAEAGEYKFDIILDQRQTMTDDKNAIASIFENIAADQGIKLETVIQGNTIKVHAVGELAEAGGGYSGPFKQNSQYPETAFYPSYSFVNPDDQIKNFLNSLGATSIIIESDRNLIGPDKVTITWDCCKKKTSSESDHSTINDIKLKVEELEKRVEALETKSGGSEKQERHYEK